MADLETHTPHASKPSGPAREAAPTPSATALLRRAGRLRPQGPRDDESLWRRIAADLPRRRMRRLLREAALAAPALALAAAAIVLFASPSPVPSPSAPPEAARDANPWTAVDFGDIGQVLADGAARGSLRLEDGDAERRIHARAGRINATIAPQRPERPVVVVTPHVRIRVVGTRFSVTVESAFTGVFVEEGSVRVESPSGAAVMLFPGESIRSDDARLTRPPAPPARAAAAPSAAGSPSRSMAASRRARPAPPASARTGGGAAEPVALPSLDECALVAEPASERDCYQRLLQAGGDAARNATFALGLLARERGDAAEARARWSDYLRQFPGGELAPEASLGLFELAVQERRLGEALSRAEEFQAAFAADPRAAEVGLAAAQILCRDLARPGEAAEAFERLLHTAGPAFRARVLEARRHCAE